MKKKNPKRKKRIAIIILVLFVLIVGFAYLTATLTIGGTAVFDPHEWDIHWELVDAHASNGVTVEQDPSIDQSRTGIVDAFTLYKPGDNVDVVLDAVNGGTLDVMIGEIILTINDSPDISEYLQYLNIDVYYEDGVPVMENHILKAHSSERFVVRVEYDNMDVTAADLPGTDQSLSMHLGVVYELADKNAVAVRNVYYTSSTTPISLKRPLPDNIDVYNNPQDAMDAWNTPLFLKVLVSKGVVESIYVGFEYDNQIYEDELHAGYIYNKQNKTFASTFFPVGTVDVLRIGAAQRMYSYYNVDYSMGLMSEANGSVGVGYDCNNDGHSCNYTCVGYGHIGIVNYDNTAFCVAA